MEPFDQLRPDRACIVALNAGGVFRTGSFGRIPVIRDLIRSEALLYRQSTALRTRRAVERFQAWERARNTNQPAPPDAQQGVLFGLASTIALVPGEWAESRPEHQELDPSRLARLATSFAKFPLTSAVSWSTGAGGSPAPAWPPTIGSCSRPTCRTGVNAPDRLRLLPMPRRRQVRTAGDQEPADQRHDQRGAIGWPPTTARTSRHCSAATGRGTWSPLPWRLAEARAGLPRRS